MRALVIGERERSRIAALRARAVEHPLDMAAVLADCRTSDGVAKHRERVSKQSVVLPVGYWVTFSVDVGHPGGSARHISISVGKPTKRLPSPEAVDMILEEFGFVGGLSACAAVYLEDTDDGGQAVNALQFIAPSPPSEGTA